MPDQYEIHTGWQVASPLEPLKRFYGDYMGMDDNPRPTSIPPFRIEVRKPTEITVIKNLVVARAGFGKVEHAAILFEPRPLTEEIDFFQEAKNFHKFLLDTLPSKTLENLIQLLKEDS